MVIWSPVFVALLDGKVVVLEVDVQIRPRMRRSRIHCQMMARHLAAVHFDNGVLDLDLAIRLVKAS